MAGINARDILDAAFGDFEIIISTDTSTEVVRILLNHAKESVFDKTLNKEQILNLLKEYNLQPREINRAFGLFVKAEVSKLIKQWQDQQSIARN